MGFLTNTIKWSAKLGVGGGALYLVNQKKLFGNVDQAENGVKEMQSDVNNLRQYVPKEGLEGLSDVADKMKEMTKDLPELKLTSSETGPRGLWNKGVLASFRGITYAPQAIKNYTNDVVVYIKEEMTPKQS